MAKRCGCASEFCACVVVAGDGVTVEGQGTKTFPYEISAIPGTVDLAVQDENVVVVASATIFDFQGAGVTATQGASGEAIITIPGASGTYPWDSAWASYTPAMSGFTPGASTATGQWTAIGKTIHVHARITLGTGFAFLAGQAPTVTLPVALKTIGPNRVVLTDVGSNSYAGNAAIAATMLAYSTGTNGAYAAITATVPFTWVVGDLIDYYLTYERT